MKQIEKKKGTIPLSFGSGHIGQVLALDDVTHRPESQDPQGTYGSTCCIPGAGGGGT